MNLKTIHRAYKDEIIRAYGFIGKIKVWNSNKEPDEKSVLKMIKSGFEDYRQMIINGLDRTFLDRQMGEKEYKTYKYVAKKLPKAYVVKNFPKTAENTDLNISLFLDMGRR
jgi:hypothetical protein